MRHVSRTHNVALDWLFDRINLDPKKQIKYVDTRNHLADILTTGSFARDEGNHLLCLFNILSKSVFSCIHFSEMMIFVPCQKKADAGWKTSRRRMALVAKSRPARNLVSLNLNRSFTVPSSSSSQRPGNLTANCSTWGSLSTGKPVRWIRKRTTHQALKCGTQMLTRTLAPRTCCPNEKEHRWSKFVPSQIGPIARHCRVHGESLHTRTTETWSLTGRQNGADQHQRSDLGDYSGLHP